MGPDSLAADGPAATTPVTLGYRWPMIGGCGWLGHVGASWSHERYCDEAEREIGRFTDAVRDADLETPVPTCPGWDLAALIRHLGGTHRWAAGNIAARSTKRLGLRELGVKFPQEHGEHLPWFAEGAEELMRVLRESDPDEAVWAWGADQRVRFWSRRMLHETDIHRVDADFAVGREPVVEPDVAHDGIDELRGDLTYAANFTPKLRELSGEGETLAFHATDTGGRWGFRLVPEGWAEVPGEEGADVTVRAAAADLFLFLWGRRKMDDPRLLISGDEALLIRWVEHTAI